MRLTVKRSIPRRIASVHLTAPAPAALASVAAVSLLLLCTCRLVNLQRLECSHNPCRADQIVGTKDLLWIEFSIPLVQEEVEALCAVCDESGPVDGELTWAGNRLSFDPVPALRPGVRYVLSCCGTVGSVDGRTFTLDVRVPFFFQTKGPPPQLIQQEPGSAETVSVHEPLRLTFSKPMDTGAFADGFHIVPDTSWSVSWSSGRDTVTVSPDPAWDNLTYYSWSLSRDVSDEDGVPLACTYASGFIVQEDMTGPTLIEVQPAVRSGSVFLPVEPSDPVAPLDDLLYRDAILLTFSEAVDFHSVERAFQLDPGVSGALEEIDPVSFAFVPADGYTMNQHYRLRIASSVNDLAGNPAPEEVELWFTPDIPLQSVERIRCEGASTRDYLPADFNLSTPQPFDFTEIGPDRFHTFVIAFSVAFDHESRTRMTDAVRCEAFYPSSIWSPELESASWNVPGTELTLHYAGFEESPAGSQKNLYRLFISGGSQTSVNQLGSFLQEDVWLLLEAPPA